jgi:hypothetical protein
VAPPALSVPRHARANCQTSLGARALAARRLRKICSSPKLGLSDLADAGVHALPGDFRAALLASAPALAAWRVITPLARNEFVCWVLDAKLAATRARRIARACDSLGAGKRRPCCWPGCKHRVRSGGL